MDYSFVIMLTDDFLIERKSQTSDGAGGNSISFVTVDTVKGRLDDERFQEVMRGGQDVVYVTHRLFMFPGTDIQREDRITGIGHIFRVIYLRTVHEDHPLEVMCEEIDP